MTGYPRIVIDLSKLIHNWRQIQARCVRHHVTMTAVVKGLAGDMRVIQAWVETGLTEIGDSRPENLVNLAPFPQVHKMLLRLPALSRLTETIAYCNVSLNSEKETLARLDNCPNGEHQVFLMVDLGDLREGFCENQIHEMAVFCQKLKKVRVTGLGTNFSCFAGALPTVAKLERLVLLAKLLHDEYKLPIQYVSGGNSSSLPLLYDDSLPAGINHLRIGEGILLGRETLHGNILPDLYPDAFMVEAEIIQVQWKPGRTDGEIGRDAFGRKPEIPVVSPGIRLLLNIGHQDTPLTGLMPLDPELSVLGGSSDYLVMASEKTHKVGEIVQFRPNYWSLLALMTSPYVEKCYLE